jgi:hypothetical protein
MAPKSTLTIKVNITGVRTTLAQLNSLPKEANQEMRERAGVIAEKLATSARRGAAVFGGPQGPLLVPTIKVVRDRVPVVQAGGSSRIGRRRVQAFKLLFGVEFGSNFYNQFHGPHTSEGFFLFPLVRTERPMVEREFNAAAQAIIDKFNQGGG